MLLTLPAKNSTSRKRTAKKAAKQKSFEETLWDTATADEVSADACSMTHQSTFKSILPEDYFSRPGFFGRKLSVIIRAFNDIDDKGEKVWGYIGMNIKVLLRTLLLQKPRSKTADYGKDFGELESNGHFQRFSPLASIPRSFNQI
ncbi:MAG: hypothetical protein ACON4R_08615 [Akkermansiaceae bacterium]